jgi:8-amino-7-oxononanoate synthase
VEKKPNGILQKLKKRSSESSLRTLSLASEGIDFYSNDYLGFARNKVIFFEAKQMLQHYQLEVNSAAGSRLLSGNTQLHEDIEQQIAEFHEAETAVLFNSGYDANLGFFSSVPQRTDIVFYDEFSHASIRDGLKLGLAKSYKFKHNDLEDLNEKLQKQTCSESIYVVTESVFSMDGDSPDFQELIIICEENEAFLVVDEAHALGVFGENGAGLLQQQQLENQVFARIMTFGKGLGAHGAAILGSQELKSFLINFARSFIYSTAISPHSVATISSAYALLEKTEAIQQLQQKIQFFKNQVAELGLNSIFIESNSAIQSCLVSGNEEVKSLAEKIQQQQFLVKPILAPTVPKGQERLRFCLHSYNSEEEIFKVLHVLSTFVA